MPRSRTSTAFEITNFAHISKIALELGDLTVLVGPQGAGKSLALQLFKLACDHREVVSALRDAGDAFDDAESLLDLYLGRGMAGALKPSTRIALAGKQLDLARIARSHGRDDGGRVFYIPAHRALLLADGWPAPFRRLTSDTPAVARLFSENLFNLFANPRDSALFPVERRLKSDYRQVIDEAVYHGGHVSVDAVEHRKRLELSYDRRRTRLPFMTWTAGQREFTPLLLGLYHLLPSRKQSKARGVDWVIVEEPEMGLHPQALTAVMLLVLELLWRGYRVILSTHATLVLDVVFTLRTIGEAERAAPKRLYDAFGIRKYRGTQEVLDYAIGLSYRTFLFDFEGARVVSKDISTLDPSSEDRDRAEWGGLTGFSSRFNRALSDALTGAD